MPVLEGTDTVQRLREMWQRAKAEKDRYHQEWERLYKTLWESRTMPQGKNTGRPGRVQANEIMPIVTALVGWMGDARPKISVAPATYNPESTAYPVAAQLAQDMERTFEWVHRQNRFDLEAEKAFFDGFTYGTGIFKAAWDPEMHRDGIGDVRERWVDAWDLYPDPLAHDTRDWTYVFERKVMSRQMGREIYGDVVEELGQGDEFGGTDRPKLVDRNQAARGPMAIAGPILGQGTVYGAGAGADWSGGADQDRIVVLEGWWKDYDGRWKMSTIAGNRELHDTLDVKDDLYDFGEPPYERFVVHDMGEFWGPSLVAFLLSPQGALNDLLFHAHNNARLVGDPMFLEAVQAGTAKTRLVNRPGQRVPVAAPGMVEWMKPPEMPVIVVELIKFWVAEMERISGLSGITRGAAPSRRESEQALTTLAEGSATRVRNALRNLEWGLIGLGEKVAELVAENYTEDRIVSLVGPEGQPTALALRSNHFWMRKEGKEGRPTGQPQPLRFTIWVEAGSSNPASRQGQIAEAQSMFGMGIIDREAYLAFRRWPGWRQIVERIATKEAQGAFQAPASRRRQR